MSYDLCVYGHLTIDRVFDGSKEILTLGAMANVWDSLKLIDSDLTVKLNPTAMGEAIILINKNSTERISRANLNIKHLIPKIIDAKWHHIMYLNKLVDYSFIKNIKGIISADITSGVVDDQMPFLDKLDYLFISDEDLNIDINKLTKKVKGKVILHYPSGSVVSDGKNIFTTKTKLLKNIDVLGAGDIFASCFINYMLKNYEIKKAILLSHKKTSEILIEKSK